MSEENVIKKLRNSKGIIEICLCPKCKHFVEPCDMVWENGFLEIGEMGEAISCRYCEE